ncbi:MAG: hypothetical protein Q4D88_00750 [Anaerococcus sp.]|nr:hypothetical protein [Anaerococcus sp.]
MIKLLKRDLFYIIDRSKRLMILYAFLLILTQFYILPNGDYNSMELFIGLLADQGYIHSLANFSPPFIWLLFQLIPTFIISFISYQDHVDNASYILLKTRSRMVYFGSKILAGLIALGIIHLFTALLVVADNILVSFYDRSFALIYLRLVISYIISQFLLYFLSFILSIKYGYKFGVASILISLTLSMATNFKGFLGQQTLAFKQDVMGGYISFFDNILVWSIYLIALSLIAYKIFRSYDFYGSSYD